MSDPKVTAAHLRRAAAVYCRQSTLIQVERNRESTLRQYDLVSRAGALGWPRSAIRVIDADPGVSGSGLAARAGFTQLTGQIALGQVGVVLALEVSRLARSSAEWYRLLDLCGITDTLIADEASVYHPGMFDDRLLLGLKGTMAEAELQVLRARMLGGLRNKAARGELRIPLPAGLVWGEAPGQILLHPDEAVRGAIGAVFDRFAACGSARQVWLWLRENGLQLPSLRDGQLAWSTAAYPAVHKILTHPGYAGACVYGRTRGERYIDAAGAPAARRRAVPRPEDWQVLITGHHPGYISWDTYLANTARLAANMAPARGAAGTGATREGCALLQGLALCGVCGRRLGVFYRVPAKSAPGYQCNGGVLVGGGQGRFCTRVSGVRIDPAVAQHVLETLTPVALEAALDAADQIEAGHDAALEQWRRQAEQARYAATRAERRYRAVDPENRLVARGLEAEWEAALQAVREADAELGRREKARPVQLSPRETPDIAEMSALRVAIHMHRIVYPMHSLVAVRFCTNPRLLADSCPALGSSRIKGFGALTRAQTLRRYHSLKRTVPQQYKLDQGTILETWPPDHCMCGMIMHVRISLTLLALLLSSLCYGTSSVLQARAALSSSGTTTESSGRLFLTLLRKITYLGSLALSGLGFLAQIPALRYFPLFVVQAFQGANLAITALVGIPLLGLRLHLRDWASITGVVAGLSLLVISFTTVQNRTVSTVNIRTALLFWTIFLVIASYGIRKMPNVVSCLGLGFIAGLAFGTVGVAVRVIPNLLELTLLRDPALYALLGSGILGFMMYADGLRRGPVTSTTAALLIAQIVGSAVLGELILGDRIKIGFVFPAVVGAVITVSAAISLARFAQLSDRRRIFDRQAESGAQP